MLKTSQTGDTIVEVLFAVAAFSILMVGSISIMNKGLNAAQRALEITLVREQINSQAETLRYLNTSYITARQSGDTTYLDYKSSTAASYWYKIEQYIKTNKSVSNFELNSCPKTSSDLANNSFIMNTRTAAFLRFPTDIAYNQSSTFSQMQYDDTSNKATMVNGIWIEAVRKTFTSNSQDDAGYIDFNIRACWDSPGQSVPVTLGTIVRLYEPL